jgi:hypothetical protein
VLAVRRQLLTNRVPAVVGGGTVAYVNPEEHVYLEDPVAREEGGTPAIVESVRAGLVFQLKDAVGVDVIRQHESDYVIRAIEAWSHIPEIEVLGNVAAERLSILSFVVRRPTGQYLHHNAVVALLNDLFGIQARGGCSCAGPYGHRLLGINIEQSHEFERVITAGCEGIKPGWVRVNFNYFIDEAVFDYVVRAIAFVAQHGHQFLNDYRFDSDTGLWRHANEPTDVPLRLAKLRYDDEGLLAQPAPPEAARPDVLDRYLNEAETLLAERIDTLANGEASLGGDFDALRWFELPTECVPGDSKAPTQPRES